jgi:adenosylmethionine-8-amino-7-oxononanoate aminotransferase
MEMAGKDGDGLVISPPFIIEEEDLDFVVRSLAQAIDKVLG